MNKPINIQSFVCEISKCPDIQRLKSENEELKKAKEEYYLNNLYYERKLSELTQALEDVRDCINVLTTVDNDFRGSMVEWKINKIINEVLKSENH